MARPLDRAAKAAVEGLLRPFLGRREMDPATVAGLDARAVLVVRQHNQMGDMFCALPCLRAVRETFPGASITVVASPSNRVVVEGHPLVDRVLVYAKRELRGSPRRMRDFLRELRTPRPDLAIVLNSTSFSVTSAWLARLSGARVVIGGDSRPFGRSTSDWIYDVALPTRSVPDRHIVDHMLWSLAPSGIGTDDRSVDFEPGEEAAAGARGFLDGLRPGLRLAVHPGAGKPPNRWPAERFTEVLREAKKRGWSAWVLEGPADGEVVARVLDAPGVDVPVLRDVPLRVAAAALQGSDIVLVNDTGVMHLAAAVGAHVLALFGPTRADHWSPPSPRVRTLQGEGRRMDTIPVQAVIRELDGIARAQSM